jgi:hypothetical protein
MLTITYSAAANALLADPSLRSDILAAAQLPEALVSYATPGSHTFTVPDGVYSILVRLWGAGGGGGYAMSGSNGRGGPSGGAGGAYAEKRFSVTPGQTVTVVVGAGGAGGNASPQNGQPGLSSTVTVDGVTVTAGGGSGGNNCSAPDTVADGSFGGLPSGNADFGIPGSDGGLGLVQDALLYGGTPPVYAYAGGGGAGANGGSGRTLSVSGQVGYAPGGGGWGSSREGGAGGNGAAGRAEISYIPV